MKKTLFFLVALAALSSCVEDNAIAPTQPADGQVTINAVAADTKTLLDGTSVVWESDDVIAVVLGNEMVEFSAAEVNGAAAEFKGTIDVTGYETAYAVYPATAYNADEFKVSHTLPASQTGVVTSEMNLSSALLSVDALKTGEADAQFKNALSLLQVTVPEGVTSVAFTASQEGLVGSTEFYVTDGILSRKSLNTGSTVTLSTGSELAAGTYNLLVYPGNPGNLTLTMVGTDGAEFTKTVSGYRFEASQYYTIDLTAIFAMETQEEMYVSPLGGEVVVPIYTVADYEYTVAVEGTPSWLTYTVPTKGFHQDQIVFTATANTAGAERSANVTITWGEANTRTFKIIQTGVFMDIVQDENGDPIQWEESFGVYASEEDALAGSNAKATFTNVFTIALSGDPSKGAYKISNMFKTDYYYNNGLQSGKGGEYYADYDATTSKLTIKKENAVQSYFFTGDVVLSYDAENNTFAAESPMAFNLNMYSSYNKDGYIGNYSVKVYEETVSDDDSSLAAFVGTWSESFTNSYWMGEGDYDNVDAVKVSIVDGKLYFENMFAVNSSGTLYSGSYYGTLSADGATITLADANSNGHGVFGPMSYSSTNPIVLTVVDGKLKTSADPYGKIQNYVATK